jgi:hypothetical protein
MLDWLVFVPSLMQWTGVLAVTLVATLSASRHRVRSGIPIVASAVRIYRGNRHD